MKTYEIKYAKGDIDWSTVPKLDVDEYNWGEDCGIRTQFQIVWNEEGLSCHGVSVEKDILARYDDQNCPVWCDSCMEFFFHPVENDSRYLNFECNPNGAIYTGIGTNMPDRVRLIEQNEKQDFSIKTARTQDGWEMYLTVPVSFISMFYPGYELREGMIIKANCMKCGDDTVYQHFISWNKYPEEPITFHNSAAFGEMILVK
ncbi:MAG: carbohydrate-binding family 9-like protein [Lachnospiraceae bacterium]|nr:carbohydrate-binding family 9-like protein [Lachnospiraceae bacterium]